MRNKIREWLVRYIPSEILGTTTAYLGYYYGFMASANHTAAAFAASISENFGFYSIILFREIMTKRRARGSITLADLALIVTGMIVEFGPSELLDSFIVRPFTIGLGTHYLGMEWGVLFGKLAADVTFFIPAIALYEFKRNYLAKRANIS